jgi:glutamate-5-semialdehyde dehydrogenase
MSVSEISISEMGFSARKAGNFLRQASTASKNKVLNQLAEQLISKEKQIIEENEKDLIAGKNNNLSPALMDRLELNSKRISAMSSSLEQIANLEDPVGQIISGWKMPAGMQIRKQRIPLGVLAVIYESRPNVTIDVAALALKSGNAVILRGGKEAIHSNIFLAKLFIEMLRSEGFPAYAVQLVQKTEREYMQELLQESENIDLVVPRGGHGLIKFVRDNSKIPIVKHDAGICHCFVDESAIKDMAIDIVINGKTQRPSVCNALETVIIHKGWKYSADLLKRLDQKNVVLRGDEDAISFANQSGIILQSLEATGYKTEYLDMELSVKFTDNLAQAIDHIEENTSYHSEVIISESAQNIHAFEKSLDSAAIFINCSSRFHDGGEFGLGAEVGIGTGKLHSRGPMTLADLTTFKYVINGQGQFRN